MPSPPGLVALGLKPGDRIGIWSPNNAEWIVTQFATAKAGLILVNINPAYRLSEVEYALNKVGCRGADHRDAVQDQRLHRHDQHAGAGAGRSPTPGDLHAGRLPALRVVIQIGGRRRPGTFAFDDRPTDGRRGRTQRLRELAPVLQFDDPINIQFTSGTTGLPKGATLTHHNILNNGFFIGEVMHYTEAGQGLHPGADVSLLRHGDRQPRLPDARLGDRLPRRGLRSARDAGNRGRRIAARRSTACRRCSSPNSIIRSSANFDLTSLRTGMMAGAPCPIEVMRRCIRDMHLTEITIGYGMTETSPVSTRPASAIRWSMQVGTVGRPHPHVEVKIIDTEGRVVPRRHHRRVLHPRLLGDARLLG